MCDCRIYHSLGEEALTTENEYAGQFARDTIRDHTLSPDPATCGTPLRPPYRKPTLEGVYYETHYGNDETPV